MHVVGCLLATELCNITAACNDCVSVYVLHFYISGICVPCLLLNISNGHKLSIDNSIMVNPKSCRILVTFDLEF